MDDETKTKIHETHRDVAVLKEQYEQLDERVVNHREQLGKHDERLSKIESFKTKVKAVLGAGSLAVASGWALLKQYGHRLFG